MGPPHGVPGDHPPYGSDFPGPPFDGSGRVIYPGDSYRTADNDMYNPAPSPDFASTVSFGAKFELPFKKFELPYKKFETSFKKFESSFRKFELSFNRSSRR